MAATLLLADDSVTIQRVIELTFAGEDVNVVAVGDGDTAIARLESSPPDIVLADVGMPGRSGYEIAQYVKRTPRLAHIPVILLTGAFEPIDRSRASAVGCDGVLAKPFEPQLVIARVKDLLDRRAPELPGAAAPGPRRPDLDEYFDQLDAAFANLATSSARAGDSRSVDASDVPLTYASPEAHFTLAGDRHGPEPVETESTDNGREAASASRPALPSLADAFAALLAAERAGTSASAGSRWPGLAGRSDTLDDDTIDRIAIRVAAQLSDRAVREAVNEIVGATAERLVREEIERIKAGIK